MISEHLRGRLPAILAVAAAPALTATALRPLFAGFLWWYLPALVSITLATVTAELLRGVRLPRPVQYAVAAVAFVVMLTVLCASDTAVLYLIPGPHTFSTLWRQLGAGWQDVSRLAPPVPRRSGLVMLVIIAMYLLTALVDMFAVHLRRPTLAGLPLLALFVFAATVVNRGVGLLPFVLGAVGYLGLLLVEGREAADGWGQQVISRSGQRSSMPVGWTGLRVGAVALVGAAALPFAVPGLGNDGLLRSLGWSGDRAPTPTTAVVDQPIVWVSTQLHDARTIPLMSVSTATPTYIRLTALEQFDGASFTLRKLSATAQDRIGRGLPSTASGTPTATINATVSVSPNYDGHYTPLLGAPVKINGLAGDWRLSQPTGTVFSASDTISGKRFDETVAAPAPTAAQLAAQPLAVPPDLRLDTQLPASTDPRIGQLARAIAARANARTTYAKSEALMRFLLASPFKYNINGAPAPGPDALSEFLFVSHQGYCQQYASAMTVLARSLGLPARVAVGFLAGTPQPDGSYLVTNQDAHAWTEVWFPQSGWIRFDATPRSDSVATTQPPYAQGPASVTPTPTGPGATAAPVRPGGAATGTTGNRAGGGSHPATAPAAHQHQSMFAWSLTETIILIVLLLAATPALLRLLRRRHRLRLAAAGRPAGSRAAGSGGGGRRRAAAGNGAGSVADLTRTAIHGTWDEFTDVAADLGYPIGGSESPRAVTARLVDQVEVANSGLAGGTATGGGGETAGVERPERDLVLSGAMPRPRNGGGASGDDEWHGALRRLAAAEETARYAPPDLLAGIDPRGLAADVRTASRQLRASATVARRVRAHLAPRSVTRSVTGADGTSGTEFVVHVTVGAAVGLAGAAGRLGGHAVRTLRRPPSDDANAPRGGSAAAPGPAGIDPGDRPPGRRRGR